MIVDDWIITPEMLKKADEFKLELLLLLKRITQSATDLKVVLGEDDARFALDLWAKIKQNTFSRYDE